MAAARGVQLPKELAAAAAAGGLYRSVLGRYIQLQARQCRPSRSPCELQPFCFFTSFGIFQAMLHRRWGGGAMKLLGCSSGCELGVLVPEWTARKPCCW